MVCNLQISPYNWITCPLFIYLFICLFVCLFCPLLSEISRNNQFQWIAAEAGKGEFVAVKHRQPKPMPSHTDTLPEESSVVEMTKQANTHQAPVSMPRGRMRQVLHDARTSGAASHVRQARIPRGREPLPT